MLICLALIVAAEYVLHNAEPILRRRIIETLAARFDMPVELDRLSISLFKGVEVEGWGLHIPYGVGVEAGSPAHPLLAVRHFAFRITLGGLLHQPTHVHSVEVDGMELYVPPANERARLLAGWKGSGEDGQAADPDHPNLKAKVAILLNELRCRELRIVLEPGGPATEAAQSTQSRRAPLEFDIAALTLRNLGPRQVMLYDAQLTNPKPIGTIHVSGDFGPWGGNTPGGPAAETPVDGRYSFDHADLSTINGISGMLSSTGRFAGVLDRLIVDGTTETPDFSLDISNRQAPLRTRFHAIVDGTSGDTYLEPVEAHLEHSDFTVTGKVVKIPGKGHDIQLDVEIPHGRMEDFLRLATKTSPPLMNGTLAMRARLEIPPGKRRVPEKLAMTGSFSIAGVQFNDRKTQDQIDGLSARALGHPEEAKMAGREGHPEISSQLGANFTIDHGVMSVTDVRFALPGALLLINGVYSMDGKLFEFKGRVRTEATASEMVGGWKGMLLKPLDKLLEKNGAGVELPIEISGTSGEVHFGLATHGINDTPGQMLADAKGNAKARGEMSSARSESAQADAEDAAAARAPTLEEAERLHAAAVHHRAEAQSRVLAAQKGSSSNP